MINKAFWQGKKVFITGHTGFKGSWLCLWLHSLGAHVTGYALDPPTQPSLFHLCQIQTLTKTITGDVRDRNSLYDAIQEAEPDIIFHMAAQPIVSVSYQNPIETYETNVMGTVNLLDAVHEFSRKKQTIKAVINITSDKCYQNKESVWGYRENDQLGGYDPYSNSKACAELITASYRSSFFNPKSYTVHGVALASARAGNVIGGGDFAIDRLVPDCIKHLTENKEIIIRNPLAIRPWQHVLEPLGGYLLLAQKLYEDGVSFGEAWNFGPADTDARSVEWIVKRICAAWEPFASYKVDAKNNQHEAQFLRLDCSKSRQQLGWVPRWGLDDAIKKVFEWTKAYQNKQNLRDVCFQQIDAYSNCKGEV